LYYPPVEKRDHESWILTNPSLALTLRVGPGSIYGGAGALFASCTDGIANYLTGKRGSENVMRGTPMVDGVWETAHAGGSLATSTHTHLVLESALMMSSLEPSQTYAEKIGPPFLAEVGARRVF